MCDESVFYVHESTCRRSSVGVGRRACYEVNAVSLLGVALGCCVGGDRGGGGGVFCTFRDGVLSVCPRLDWSVHSTEFSFAGEDFASEKRRVPLAQVHTPPQSARTETLRPPCVYPFAPVCCLLSRCRTHGCCSFFFFRLPGGRCRRGRVAPERPRPVFVAVLDLGNARGERRGRR